MAESITASYFPRHDASNDFIGTPWEEFGRAPNVGLDCVGTVLEWYRLNGHSLPDPKQNTREEILKSALCQHFYEVKTVDYGDVLDFSGAKKGDDHLGIALDTGLLHAAELGGVTIRPYSFVVNNYKIFRMKGLPRS